MKTRFNIEAVEDIVSKLKFNYTGLCGPISQPSGHAGLLRAIEEKKDPLSEAWQSIIATGFFNTFDYTILKYSNNNNEYKDLIQYLSKVKNDYDEAKNDVFSLSEQLYDECFNSITFKYNIGRTIAKEPDKISSGWISEVKNQLNRLESGYKKRLGEQIVKIEKAWSDEDEKRLLEVLEMVNYLINEMINFCYRIIDMYNKNAELN